MDLSWWEGPCERHVVCFGVRISSNHRCRRVVVASSAINEPWCRRRTASQQLPSSSGSTAWYAHLLAANSFDHPTLQCGSYTNMVWMRICVIYWHKGLKKIKRLLLDQNSRKTIFILLFRQYRVQKHFGRYVNLIFESFLFYYSWSRHRETNDPK